MKPSVRTGRLYSEKGAETQEIRGVSGNRDTVRLAARENKGRARPFDSGQGRQPASPLQTSEKVQAASRQPSPGVLRPFLAPPGSSDRGVAVPARRAGPRRLPTLYACG